MLTFAVIAIVCFLCSIVIPLKTFVSNLKYNFDFVVTCMGATIEITAFVTFNALQTKLRSTRGYKKDHEMIFKLYGQTNKIAYRLNRFSFPKGLSISSL